MLSADHVSTLKDYILNVVGVIALVFAMSMILYVCISKIDPWMSGHEEKDDQTDSNARRM